MKTLIDFGQMQVVVKNFLKTLIFVIAGVFLYRVHNQNLIERKNLDLRGLLSSVECREESFCSSNNLVVSRPKGKTFW